MTPANSSSNWGWPSLRQNTRELPMGVAVTRRRSGEDAPSGGAPRKVNDFLQEFARAKRNKRACKYDGRLCFDVETVIADSYSNVEIRNRDRCQLSRPRSLSASACGPAPAPRLGSAPRGSNNMNNNNNNKHHNHSSSNNDNNINNDIDNNTNHNNDHNHNKAAAVALDPEPGDRGESLPAPELARAKTHWNNYHDMFSTGRNQRDGP